MEFEAYHPNAVPTSYTAGYSNSELYHQSLSKAETTTGYLEHTPIQALRPLSINIPESDQFQPLYSTAVCDVLFPWTDSQWLLLLWLLVLCVCEEQNIGTGAACSEVGRYDPNCGVN